MTPKPRDPLRVALSEMLEKGDVTGVRKLLTEHPEYLHQEYVGGSLLHKAASEDNVEMIAMLVELGLDVNQPSARDPEGAVHSAAQFGCINVARWLLERGAKLNFDVRGEIRVASLVSPIIDGNLEFVKLLVEYGADINAVWGQPPMSPLSFAIMYEQKEVEEYLRSLGAKLPEELPRKHPPPSFAAADPILRHIEKYLRKTEALVLQEIVPGDPPIKIYVVPCDKTKRKSHVTLVTSGMSARALTVPKGQEAYQYAELVMYLPDWWPLDKESLSYPHWNWPLEWLRKIARYPHDNKTWLGGPATIIANGEPPEPLAPNTELSCLLALTEHTDFGVLQLPDGRTVVFYTLIPIYAEERDLEKKEGVEHLLALFEKHKIDTVVDIVRKNVALEGK